MVNKNLDSSECYTMSPSYIYIYKQCKRQAFVYSCSTISCSTGDHLYRHVRHLLWQTFPAQSHKKNEACDLYTLYYQTSYIPGVRYAHLYVTLMCLHLLSTCHSESESWGGVGGRTGRKIFNLLVLIHLDKFGSCALKQTLEYLEERRVSCRI